ncbi:transposase [Corynebacterium phocae]|uniref:Transposase n=1 Tax=Corynebacterium phocae TaxID=161895 RepID=A0A1L7D0N7_9CORY|nr:transposase [Corynebacterium phocae]
MSRLLEVSRSCYYDWEKKQERILAGEDEKTNYYQLLDAEIYRLWEASDGTYGAPRITADLADLGYSVDKKTVAKRMKYMAIEGISPRKFKRSKKIGDSPTSSLPDLVKRKFDQGAMDKVWLSDITQLPTAEGPLYLCAVRDGHSRRTLGFAFSEIQDTNLVERALRMAYVLRGVLPKEVIFHADRGTQFTSDQMHQVCKELGIKQSVGRTGVCFDNAMAESFWSTLKTEFYYRRKWMSRREAAKGTARWMEEFYNRKRRHSSIKMLSPVNYEKLINSNQGNTQKVS